VAWRWNEWYCDVCVAAIAVDLRIRNLDDVMVAVNERILNRKSGGFASRRRLGALCAVQESAQSEKSVDRFPTPVLLFPPPPLW
jgi:hypothetical protein